MWMNRTDIADAVDSIREPGYLASAARFLQSFQMLIDDISDGWPYWAYGTRCSDRLQDIVRQARAQANRIMGNCVSRADTAAACRKVCTFLKRCRQTKDKPEVRAFLARHMCYSAGRSKG